MPSLAVLTVVLALIWAIAAALCWRAGLRGRAAWCLLVVAGQAVAAIHGAQPLVLISWLGFGLAYPSGQIAGVVRQSVLAAGTFALAAWSGALLLGDATPSPSIFATAALVITAVTAIAIVQRGQHASSADRAAIEWLAASAVLAAAAGAVLLSTHVMIGVPGALRMWLAVPVLLVPLSQILAALLARPRLAETALIQALVISGLAILTVIVYLVVVVGLGHAPEGAERGILISSLTAAVVVAALAQPVRHRLTELGAALVNRREGSAEEVVTTFGARMSRAVPMDELMLQLTESLRDTIADGGAEIWVGADGVLDRTVSVPRRSARRLELHDRERVVVGRARIGGLSWASVWLPELAQEPLAESFNQPRTPERDELKPDLRIAPVAHLGELLGLIVVHRLPGSSPLSDDDDRLLVDLARQLGLALHNVRLDSALQRSLEELEERNVELQASRLRIVTASDESRQAIERNLHDGAQQHLVALAVKLGLAEQLAGDDPEMVGRLLQELRADVQTTIRELRELAHGIYPPLLRDRGLSEALRAAANRSPLECSMDVDLPHRFPQEVETATYFCCLEAMQNAGKHAGAAAKLIVSVHLSPSATGTALAFKVADDGPGFDPAGPMGHGFVNMRDRLGAIGGTLLVEAAIGTGTTICGVIPIQEDAPAGAEAPDTRTRARSGREGNADH